jgi:hypothetical protein
LRDEGFRCTSLKIILIIEGIDIGSHPESPFLLQAIALTSGGKNALSMVAAVGTKGIDRHGTREVY